MRMCGADCVELMDRSGELMSLNERGQSVERASSLLKERQSYILLQVSSESTRKTTLYYLMKDIATPQRIEYLSFKAVVLSEKLVY